VKLALISDIHGNRPALEAVLADIRDTGADAIACLGDIVGYGAEPAECLQRVRDLAPVAVIQGNHDAYAADDRDVSAFNLHAQRAILWTRAQLAPEQRQWLADLPLEARPAPDVTLVHANISDPASWGYIQFPSDGALAMLDQPTRYCFYGHTHVPVAFCQDGGAVHQIPVGDLDLARGDLWLVNVGSVGQPRDRYNRRAKYVIYDDRAEVLTVRQVRYDAQTTAEKIRAKSWPEFLAARLL
jgi:predicted phosphodiesterase